MAYIYEIVFGLQKKYQFKNCFPIAEPLLLHAVHDSNVEVVKTLLNQGISPDQPCQHEVTPLYVAIQNNDKICTEILVKFGANVNKHLITIDADDNEIDMTPLILASCLNHTEIVQILLDANASVNEKAHDGMNALMFAVANKSFNCVTMLINNGASVNNTDQLNTSPLMIAANNCYVEMIDALILKGANINHVNKFGNTALVFSACQGNERCVESLIKAGANTNICNIDQSNLLMKVQWYAPHQQIKHRIVRLLVEGGCEVNMQNDSGETALFAAIQNQDTETMKFLLQAGSNPNQNSLYNKTPLSYAASEASLLEVNLLLEAGADPNIGHPLTAVAHPETLVYLQDKQEIVKQLITAGANINTVDPEYGTVLVIASFIGSQNLVMTALNAKA
ncbi:MAG: ankyrin repeat domain-containing protein, partial [Proteobacteria bacterium]|nr:ankyrin repeat domain-containing protein [Pseudomonadota bacterium]